MNPTAVRCGGLAVMSAQPVDVVRYGALDVVLRPEAGVRPQPGGVEVVVRGPVGIATLRKGDVWIRDERALGRQGAFVDCSAAAVAARLPRRASASAERVPGSAV